MKKTNFIFTLLIFSPLLCFSQILPNNNFSETHTVPCPFDATTTIVQPFNWRLYQTLNNKWDGTVDSSFCISVIDDGLDVLVDLNTIDPHKALFIRGLSDFTPSVKLTPDWIYGTAANIQEPAGVQFRTSTDCANSICSGIIVGIEIPDSSFAGTNTRFYYDSPGGHPWISYGDFETCIPTEYFESNILSEFILKLTLEDPTIDLNGKLLKLQSTQLLNWFYAEPVFGTLQADNYNSIDSTYFISLNEIYNPFGGAGNFLFKYGDHNTYPSSNDIYYIEAEPSPNTTESSNVNIIVEEFSTVVFQPFTAFRGALVPGSDSIRHVANLINNGGDMCVEQPIDFVFDDGSKLIYNGGHINFEGKSGCLMFQNKGALVVGENQTLYYGQNGKGILALMPGGEIHLEKNSELIIDNTLWIFGLEDRKFPPEFKIYLEPGNKLTFGENAHLINHFSTAPNTQLNVYMNGGILDDSKLNASSRNLINRIYPKPAERLAENITIYKNPVEHNFNFEIITEEAGKLNLELFDMNGRLVLKEKLNVEKGINQINYPVGELNNGVYAVRLQLGQQYFTAKILKI